MKKDPGNEAKLKLNALYKQETARKNYVDMVSSLSSSESSSQIKPGADGEQRGYETLVVTSQDGITKIMLNRPTKKNAISTQMYQEIMLALKSASKDDFLIHLSERGRRANRNKSENGHHCPVDSLHSVLPSYSLQRTKHLCWLYLHNQKGNLAHLKGFSFLLQ